MYSYETSAILHLFLIHQQTKTMDSFWSEIQDAPGEIFDIEEDFQDLEENYHYTYEEFLEFLNSEWNS